MWHESIPSGIVTSNPEGGRFRVGLPGSRWTRQPGSGPAGARSVGGTRLGATKNTAREVDQQMSVGLGRAGRSPAATGPASVL